MKRPCVVNPKPDEGVYYINDTDTTQACAKVFWEKIMVENFERFIESGSMTFAIVMFCCFAVWMACSFGVLLVSRPPPVQRPLAPTDQRERCR